MDAIVIDNGVYDSILKDKIESYKFFKNLCNPRTYIDVNNYDNDRDRLKYFSCGIVDAIGNLGYSQNTQNIVYNLMCLPCFVNKLSYFPLNVSGQIHNIIEFIQINDIIIFYDFTVSKFAENCAKNQDNTFNGIVYVQHYHTHSNIRIVRKTYNNPYIKLSTLFYDKHGKEICETSSISNVEYQAKLNDSDSTYLENYDSLTSSCDIIKIGNKNLYVNSPSPPHDLSYYISPAIINLSPLPKYDTAKNISYQPFKNYFDEDSIKNVSKQEDLEKIFTEQLQSNDMRIENPSITIQPNAKEIQKPKIDESKLIQYPQMVYINIGGLNYKKLGHLHLGEANVIGFIRYVSSIGLAKNNSYWITIRITDDSIPESRDGFTITFFGRSSTDLPLLKIDCVVKLNCIAIRDHQSSLYGNSTDRTTWFLYEFDDDYIKSSGNMPESVDHTDYIKYLKIHANKRSDQSKMILLQNLSPDITEFSAIVIVLGICLFYDLNKYVLIVSDGTKCPYDTAPSLSYDKASRCDISFSMMDVHRNTRCFITFPIENRPYDLINVVPERFIRLNLFSLIIGDKADLTLCLTSTDFPIIFISPRHSQVIDLVERLNQNTKEDNYTDWCSISLPGLDIINKKVVENSFITPLETSIKVASTNDNFTTLSDSRNIVPISITRLISQKPSYSHIFRIKARIVDIFPNSLQNTIFVYCSNCFIPVNNPKLTMNNSSTPICLRCSQKTELMIRFIILLTDNKSYLPVVALNDQALKFLKIEVKMEELSLNTYTEIEKKFSTLVEAYSLKNDKFSEPVEFSLILSSAPSKNNNFEQTIPLYELFHIQ